MVRGIPEGGIVGIDTMVFIYHLEDHPEYSSVTEKLFDAVEKGKYRAVTSFVTLIEILVKSKIEGRLKVVSEYRDILLTFPHLKFCQLDLEISDLASTLRAKYSIKTADAIQVATAMAENADAYVTNDERIKKIEEIKVLLLSEWKK